MALTLETRLTDGQSTATLNYLRILSELLGGRRVLGRDVGNPLDVHDMLLRGLSVRALDALDRNLILIDRSEWLKAIGVSLRTYQRHKDSPARPLNPEQSGRAWKFAEILAKATSVFGSQEEAEQWMDRPAIGLDQRRPIDLLTTAAGVELVEDYLSRLEYGVYT